MIDSSRPLLALQRLIASAVQVTNDVPSGSKASPCTGAPPTAIDRLGTVTRLPSETDSNGLPSDFTVADWPFLTLTERPSLLRISRALPASVSISVASGRLTKL